MSSVLRDVDLDVGDVIAVPDRLEDAVCEPQSDDVLDWLLAEEMVDAIDRLLGEHPMQNPVQLPGARKVVAEGLLHNDGAVIGYARSAEHPDHVRHRVRRDRHVDKTFTAGADLSLSFAYGIGEFAAVLGAGCHEAQALRELLPMAVELHAAVGAQCLLDVGDEVVRGVSSGADDPEVIRHQPDAIQMEKSRQQLAGGEISHRAEQNQYTGRRLCESIRCHRSCSFCVVDQRVLTGGSSPYGASEVIRVSSRVTASMPAIS